jgi:imidazole glycerol-phosphate synthase subunit HisF
MLTKRIIPCLDIKDGRVVKGTSFTHLGDAGNPVDLANSYYKDGADELILLDITATSERHETLAGVIECIAREVFIPVTAGGGIYNTDSIRRVLMSGADKVSINTAAVLNPSLIKEGASKFGSQCIVVAIDVRRIDTNGEPRWEVYIHSGQRATGLDAIAWAKQAVDLGAGEILLTSMDADGHRLGYDNVLTRAISEAVTVPVIASGGAGTPEDMYRALMLGKADAVLAASIFHYGIHTVREIKLFLAEKGIPVRI